MSPTLMCRLKRKKKNNDKCHLCRKLGHYQKDCLKQGNGSEKRRSICLIKDFVFVCFESNLTKVPSNILWLNFAATTHVYDARIPLNSDHKSK
jgi:hypothetical protein